MATVSPGSIFGLTREHKGDLTPFPAAAKKVTRGDVVNELVHGLSDDEKTMLDGLFMAERRRLEEPESARSVIANQRHRQAAFVRELQRKLTGKGRD